MMFSFAEKIVNYSPLSNLLFSISLVSDWPITKITNIHYTGYSPKLICDCYLKFIYFYGSKINNCSKH